MQTDDVSIRVQTLNGTWETIGVDRLAGVYPDTDSLDLSANDWGSDKASFNLYRNPGAIWPDLSAWTPIEVEIGGEVVWSGRISETPTSEGDDRYVNVQAEGWQYHLDDDLYDKVYVHTSLRDWVDTRQIPTATLGTMPAGMGVAVGDGAISLMWPNGTPMPNNVAAGVTLDLGPNSGAIAVAADIQSSFNSAAQLYIIGHDDANWNIDSAPTTRVDWVGAQPLNAAPWTAGSQTKTFTPAAASRPFRYVTILLWTAASGGTPAADIWLKIVGFRAYGATSYQSGGNSILTADMVIKDALTRTPLLSADRTGVTAASFTIPEFVVPVTTPQTQREVWQAANAFHNYISKIDVDRRPIFQARPSAPEYEIGAWAGSEFQDASANSGDDIYNKVIVTGTAPDSGPISVRRYAGQQISSQQAFPTASPSFTNPSFATDTTGWSSTGTLTRDTTTFSTSPASGKSVVTGTANVISTTLNGTFKAGLAYVIGVAVAGPVGDSVTVMLKSPSGAVLGQSAINSLPDTAFHQIFVTAIADQDTSNVIVQVLDPNNFSTIYVDTATVTILKPTLADRWGFVKTKNLPIQSVLTSVVAQQIGDIWLQAHMRTPFKGSLAAHGLGAIRRARTGEPMHPAHMLRETGKLIRLSDRIDPDTGGQGRDGLMANVRYTHVDRLARIDLDSGRENIDAFLARLAVVTSAKLGL